MAPFKCVVQRQITRRYKDKEYFKEVIVLPKTLDLFEGFFKIYEEDGKKIVEFGNIPAGWVDINDEGNRAWLRGVLRAKDELKEEKK